MVILCINNISQISYTFFVSSFKQRLLGGRVFTNIHKISKLFFVILCMAKYEKLKDKVLHKGDLVVKHVNTLYEDSYT